MMEMDPISLRRSIGYVIQEIGLFPHWRVAANIEAVPKLGGEQKRVALAIYNLLAEGRPVAPVRVGSELGLSEDRIEEIVASWPGVFRDDETCIVGFWGLALPEMPHALEVDGRRLFGWCAWDTLFLPGLLRVTARVESTCPVTKETISLVVGPDGVDEVSPEGAVVSFLLPDRPFDSDIVQSFCHFVHFFVSEEAGSRWVSEHEGTFLLSVEEAFELGRLTNAANFRSVRDRLDADRGR